MGIPGHPDCPANDRCSPEQMRGTSEPLKGNLALHGREEVRSSVAFEYELKRGHPR